jgi:divalent metal cation (Fe/Co/Zn/Cd) transporter
VFIGAFVVGGLLAITGLGVVYTAVYSMMDITSISAMFINHNPESFSSMTWIQLTPAQYAALGVSGVSVAVKEALFRYTLYEFH